MSPELLLIRESCRVNPDVRRVAAAVENVQDWDRLLRLATWHRIRPQLYRAIKDAAGPAVPDDVVAALASANREATWKSLAVAFSLKQVATTFEENGCDFFVLKGPALAILAYGGIEKRECDDLDIFVREEDIWRAAKLLMQLEFQPEQDMSFLRGRALRQVPQLSFVHVRTKTVCELHWGLQEEKFAAAQSKTNEWWTRLVRIDLKGCVFASLAPEDLLVFLAGHGLKHGWERYKWIADLERVRTLIPEADQERVLEEARLLGLEGQLLLPLQLSQVGEGRNGPGSGEKSAHRALGRIASGWENACPTSLLSIAMIQLRFQSGFWAGLRYLAHFCFVPNKLDYERASMGENTPRGLLLNFYRFCRVVQMVANSYKNWRCRHQSSAFQGGLAL
jgi:hypothetical protein